MKKNKSVTPKTKEKDSGKGSTLKTNLKKVKVEERAPIR